MPTSKNVAQADISITKKQAGRFLLLKQLLFRPRAKLSGSAGIDTVFRRLGAIQFDPLSPCGNNVDLVLQSRVKGIKKSDYHEWVYEKRQGIEIYQKELCIVPLENIGLARGPHTKRGVARVNSFFAQNEADLKGLLDFIKGNGPISARDIDDERRLISFWGNNTSWGRTALHILWQFGELCVVGRDRNRKSYDLSRRAYGLDLKRSYPVETTRIQQEHVLGRMDNVGLLPSTGTGSGWLRTGTGKEIKSILTKLANRGDIKTVAIDGVSGNYVLRDKDLPLLEAAQRKRITKRVSFIAPLDNLMWDRNTIKEIFNFDYCWEVYTPVEQRTYGYYVLPVLFGEKFIGRIEPAVNPDTNVLEIKGFWLENGTVWTPLLRKKFDEYLEHFLAYLEVRDIIWKVPQPEEGKEYRT
ncbi:MAG: winged helix DNA-binding domain-containing protein [Deltaproteobacteria bacterium]|nr:winged helix DNA-binding domain-containing protein [Deltaproteobacteria bacterium]